jgi:hypothetical protein
MIQMQPNRRLLRAWLLLPKMSDETCAELNKGFLALPWLRACQRCAAAVCKVCGAILY